LEDVTARAVRVLREADTIACEDTRVTSKLLAHLAVRKPLVSLHAHTADRSVASLIVRVGKGERIAYVSDAGTPNVNDPGGKLVEAAFAAGVRVEPVPGPSVLTAAISVCGFPMERFMYVGFLPMKKGRQAQVRAIAEREEATVFLESTHRIAKTLDELGAVLGDRPIFVGRELTKMHETLYRGTVDEVRQRLQATSLKGEFVVIVAPL
jgi:16S rRNA (cytidine1402-2'-O)-methyltransferase